MHDEAHQYRGFAPLAGKSRCFLAKEAPFAAYIGNPESPFRNPDHVGSGGGCRSSKKAEEFAEIPISPLSRRIDF
jgi:hypothetical protein